VRHDRIADRRRLGVHEEQDLTSQRNGLARLGVEPSRIYLDQS